MAPVRFRAYEDTSDKFVIGLFLTFCAGRNCLRRTEDDSRRFVLAENRTQVNVSNLGPGVGSSLFK